MKNLLDRTVGMLGAGATTQDIFDMLTREGLSPYCAWLTYKGAELILKGSGGC